MRSRAQLGSKIITIIIITTTILLFILPMLQCISMQTLPIFVIFSLAICTIPYTCVSPWSRTGTVLSMRKGMLRHLTTASETLEWWFAA